ncbi:MAG: hypothetical protein V4565_06820 [Bacteroidota bacterium]
MRLLFIVFSILFAMASSSFAQDIIYTTGGNKLQAKVLEINTTNLKYKDYNNLEGPTYVITKTDVVLIKYANGMTEVINSNPETIEPKTESTVANNSKSNESNNAINKSRTLEKPPLNLYYLNNNMLSINALALANGDVTIMYDRDLYNSRMSLTFLGGYSFNSRMGGLNAFIADSKDNAKKKYDLGLGISFMPRNTKRVQYFVGLLGKYMSYDYQNVIDTTNNQKNYEKASAFQMAVMLTNGWVFRVSPNFNFKLFGAIGAPGNSVALKSQYTGVPKVYLGYCFGYRF